MEEISLLGERNTVRGVAQGDIPVTNEFCCRVVYMYNC